MLLTQEPTFFLFMVVTQEPTISVIAYFTTHGESHFHGLPYPSANSLDPMEHFCTFDVSKIIPKNMK